MKMFISFCMFCLFTLICMGICVLHAFLDIVKCLESPKVLYKFSVIINSSIMLEKKATILVGHT